MVKKFKRPPLNSSTFNIREICKQLLLLEEHLTDAEKFCPDCIRKHLLTVEAYAEESMTLEPNGSWVKESGRMARNARAWMVQFTDGKSIALIAKDIRSIRKKLVAVAFDPRA